MTAVTVIPDEKPFDVYLDNDPANKLFTSFSGRPLDGLGSFAMQTSIKP